LETVITERFHDFARRYPNHVIMTEYWQSQARKFCDFCKCWIADQKASIEFHENGKRHQQAVKDRLRDIGQKGVREEKKTAKEEQWLKQIEQQAMKDYRNKDLQENSDLTAKIFNEKREERETNWKEEISKEHRSKNESMGQSKDKKNETGLNKPGPPSWGVPTKTSTVPPHNASKNPFQQRISAKTHGTKYHNPRPETNWREAKTEDGNIYYWNLTSHVSVWEPPAEGYVSIKEQEEEFERLKHIENVKAREGKQLQENHNRENNQSIHSGPISKSDPYGSWETVSEKSSHESYQGTKIKSDPTSHKTGDESKSNPSNVVLHNDRTKKLEVNSKKTPTLDDDKEFEVDFSAGIAPTSQTKKRSAIQSSDSSKLAEPSKPAIVFRKRKINPDHRKVARRKEDGE